MKPGRTRARSARKNGIQPRAIAFSGLHLRLWPHGQGGPPTTQSPPARNGGAPSWVHHQRACAQKNTPSRTGSWLARNKGRGRARRYSAAGANYPHISFCNAPQPNSEVAFLRILDNFRSGSHRYERVHVRVARENHHQHTVPDELCPVRRHHMQCEGEIRARGARARASSRASPR